MLKKAISYNKQLELSSLDPSSTLKKKTRLKMSKTKLDKMVKLCDWLKDFFDGSIWRGPGPV